MGLIENSGVYKEFQTVYNRFRCLRKSNFSEPSGHRGQILKAMTSLPEAKSQDFQPWPVVAPNLSWIATGAKDMPRKQYEIDLPEEERQVKIIEAMLAGVQLKACTKCGTEWPATTEYFYPNRQYLRSACRSCFRDYCRESMRIVRSTEEGRAKVNEANRRYRSTKEGLAKNREASVKSLLTRLKTDPDYTFRCEMRGALRRTLGAKSNNYIHSRFAQFIPYTAGEYRVHIENQFEPWMNWDNQGSKPGMWECDHIVPASWFQCVNSDGSYNEPAILAAQALDNLRPLSYEANQQRKDTMTLQEWLDAPEWIKAEVVVDRIKIRAAAEAA